MHGDETASTYHGVTRNSVRRANCFCCVQIPAGSWKLEKPSDDEDRLLADEEPSWYGHQPTNTPWKKTQKSSSLTTQQIGHSALALAQVHASDKAATRSSPRLSASPSWAASLDRIIKSKQ